MGFLGIGGGKKAPKKSKTATKKRTFTAAEKASYKRGVKKGYVQMAKKAGVYTPKNSRKEITFTADAPKQLNAPKND